MLKKNTHPQPMIFLHGVRYSDITAILNFMYHGEVNVNQEDLQTFLAAAEELRIRGLSDRSGAGADAGGSRGSSPTPPAKRARPDSNNHVNSPSNRANTPNSPAVRARGPRKQSFEDERRKKNMVITPDMPDYEQTQDSDYGEMAAAFPFENSMNLGSPNGLSGMSSFQTFL